MSNGSHLSNPLPLRIRTLVVGGVEDDHAFISKKYYFQWYEALREMKSKDMRVYAQSGQYHTIVNNRDS